MPDGLSNGGAELERAKRRRDYVPEIVAQEHSDRQAYVDGGLFPAVDVVVCGRCRINPCPAGSICAECAAEDWA